MIFCIGIITGIFITVAGAIWLTHKMLEDEYAGTCKIPKRKWRLGFGNAEREFVQRHERRVLEVDWLGM